jgi:hypothetical protein
VRIRYSKSFWVGKKVGYFMEFGITVRVALDHGALLSGHWVWRSRLWVAAFSYILFFLWRVFSCPTAFFFSTNLRH